MAERRMWIRMHDTDNVATALDHLRAGTNISSDEKGIDIVLKDDIPFGHKFAIVDIPAHSAVEKYGEVIGEATKNITVGEHVHVHNVDSRRGRGDLQKEAQTK